VSQQPPRPGIESRALIEVRGIVKSYGDNAVLRGVQLRVAAGEVVALAGENGAGKSTLLGIVAGVTAADEGSIEMDGEELRQGSIALASRRGIAIVPQELAPIPDLPIYANIFLGRERRTRIGTLDRPGMIRETRELLAMFDLDLDPRRHLRTLSTATQQLIEILKGISRGARVILLDEPTSAISEQEVERLYGVVGDLRSHGVAVVFTTHKMGEIRALADRVVVLRDGVLIADAAAADITDDEIVSAMIGRDLGDLFPEGTAPAGARAMLEVDGVSAHPGSPSVSLTVAAGEIVALAGLLGAGRTSLIETVFGHRHRRGGRVRVDGREVRANRPAASIASGIALVPEDRKDGGVVLSMSILRNGVLPRLSRFTRAGWVRQRRAAMVVRDVMDSVRLRYQRLRQEVGTLSGGNQQKVVIGRWLAGDIRVLLLDEPTRGVDVGARSEIYRVITELAAERGIAVLMASSDMPEIIGLAHRILVMRGGEVVHEVRRGQELDAETLQELVFRHAAGIGTSPQEAER